MYKTLRPSVIEEMAEDGQVLVRIKDGWQMASSWSSTPANLVYCMASAEEAVFTCYITVDGKYIQITNIEPTKLIRDRKDLVDGYMYATVKGLIRFAKNLQAKRLTVDSHESSLVDHALDLGFIINPKNLSGTGGGTGYLSLEK